MLAAAALALEPSCRSAAGVDDYAFYPDCIPGTTQVCSTAVEEGDDATCRSGVQTCLEDGTGFGPCVGPPPHDDCAALADHDCDGHADACSGALEWARVVDSPEDDDLFALTPTPGGGVVAAGMYGQSLALPGTDVPICYRERCALLAAFDASGDLRWAVGQPLESPKDPADPSSPDVPWRAVAVAGAGGAAYAIVDSNAEYARVQKVGGDTGVVAWTAAGVPVSTAAPPMAAATGDRLVVTANTDAAADAAIDFGGASSGALVARGGGDFVVATFDGAGNLIDARVFGDSALQLARTIAITEEGGSVVAGCFSGTLDLGCDPLHASGGAVDGFVALLDEGGTCRAARTVDLAAADGPSCQIAAVAVPGGVAWVTRRNVGADVRELAVDRAGLDLVPTWQRAYKSSALKVDPPTLTVAADPFGNVVVATSLASSLVLAPGVVAKMTGSAPGAVVIKLAGGDGTEQWARTLEAATRVDARALATASTGHVVVAGSYAGAFATAGLPASGTGKAALFFARLAP